MKSMRGPINKQAGFAFLAGLPWLAGLIGAFFSSAFTWFLSFMTKRFAMVAAFIFSVGVLTVGLYSALVVIIDGIVYVMPVWAGAAGMFLPSNGTACATAWVTAKIARWAYDWNVKIIQFKLGL